MRLSCVSKACALVICTSLVGCAGMNYGVKGSCDTTGKCAIEGSISGTIPPGKPQMMALASQMLAATEVPDAALFEIDVSGSTISYPATGTVTITLKDTATDTVQAAKLFNWTRTGNSIRLADPDAVNAWAATEGGNANELSYKLTRFATTSGAGDQIISTAAKYEGVVKATASSSFTRCTTYPSPYQCMQ